MGPAYRAKQRLKNAVYFAVGAATQASLAGTVRRLVWEREPVLRILMYHKVNDLPDNPPSVPTAAFAAQMTWLRERYAPIAVDDLLAARRGERALPRRAVLVTFDDGYRDNLEHAAPVLHRLGIPALIFLPTAFIGAARPLPHDAGLAAANPTLGWDDARRLMDLGFEIASHGESHRIFTSVPREEAALEIRRSKATLEERLGNPVRCFAYVNGAPDTYDDAIIAAVEGAGYALAFVTTSGPVRPDDAPWTLRRYNVEPCGPYTFARLVAGDCDLIALKDSAAGRAGKRLLNRALGTAHR